MESLIEFIFGIISIGLSILPFAGFFIFIVVLVKNENKPNSFFNLGYNQPGFSARFGSNEKVNKSLFYILPEISRYRQQNSIPDISRQQKAFMVLAIAIMNIDGDRDREEYKVLLQFLSKEYGRDAYGLRGKYINKFIEFDIDYRYACKFLSRYSRYFRKSVLYAMVKIAIADKVYSDEEERLLESITNHLKLEISDLETIKSRLFTYKYKKQEQSYYQSYQSNTKTYSKNNTVLEEAYKIMGLSTNASDLEIKKAYRTLAKKYHPDKHSTKSEFLINQAEEQFETIKDAYELIKKEKNLN